MKISQLHHDKEGIQAEMEALKRLMSTFKDTAENAERRIQEYSLRESIAIRERDEIKTLLERKILRLSKQYVELFAKQNKETLIYKEFV